MKKISVLLKWLVVPVLLISCATAPRIPPPVENIPPELSFLPAGGRVYLWANAEEARPLFDVLPLYGFSTEDRGVARMLDSTETAAAVLFAEGQDRRFFLAAAGRYPRHGANWGFTFSRAWRRQRSAYGGTFWYNRHNSLAVSLARNAALVSNVDPLRSMDREIPPPGFEQFRQGSALAGWVPNPSNAIDGFLQNLGLPIQIPAEDFFFAAVRSPIAHFPIADSPAAYSPVSVYDDEYDAAEVSAPWELAFRIRAQSEMHARSLLSLFSTARFFIQMGVAAGGGFGGAPLSAGAGFPGLQEIAMLLFANAPEQEGEFLTIRIDSLDSRTIALLFTIFSVYSN